jgi:hypothetical protein
MAISCSEPNRRHYAAALVVEPPVISLAMVVALWFWLNSWWASLGMTSGDVANRLAFIWFSFTILCFIAYSLPLLFRRLKVGG